MEPPHSKSARTSSPRATREATWGRLLRTSRVLLRRLRAAGNERPGEEERMLAALMENPFVTDPFTLGGRSFASRLIVGTGKFSSPEVMADALAASGTEMVTVAIRRVDLDAPQNPITDFIDRNRYLILPNTSGAADADEAVRLARLARSAGLPPWIKVEVIPDARYLLPDPVETLKACEQLVREG